MAGDDRGIVVGITTYPDIAPLQGPELDAEDFFDWLTSSSGGDVPPDQVDKIVSSDFQPSPPAAAVKLPAQEVAQAFDRLQAGLAGYEQASRNVWVGGCMCTPRDMARRFRSLPIPNEATPRSSSRMQRISTPHT